MSLLARMRRSGLRRFSRRSDKHREELAYWRGRRDDEGRLSNTHYEHYYTTAFGLTKQEYAGKRVLDVGCGPRGTLEWADVAQERVGLDPLVPDYAELGIDRHAMTYVAAGAEDIPFPDRHFDIITTFNALDHVDDVDAAIGGITRVAALGAICLLLVEVNHAPTATEPHNLSWDLLDRFVGWQVLEEGRVAMDDQHNIYRSWERKAPWQSGPGVLGAKLERTEQPAAP
ncbi:MAG TPA: class I SAM-dependent methyltransferase [Solirubrobacteraceae bacterium]|jgi:SAM-dependent methyltransferase|nr:class I SAM-dependent methyltransferase [Solirubrobacteraceae bacterium]